ncbi:MAG TPA: ABC transporter permease subunit [Candidatus Dormibacteraeota bacterium]|jgi:ABC-type transport system involved in multi-copper enzyme maturation permease subunit
MYAAFRGELFKLVRRPGIWVLVILLLALAVTLGYAVLYLVYTFASPAASQGLPKGTTFADVKVTLYPINFVKTTFGTWGSLGGVFALIMGVLAQGSEYGWGTMKTLYTQRSGRLAMLGGKIAALAVLVLVTVIALFAVDAVASTIIALIDGKSISYPGADVVLEAIGAGFLIYGFWAMFGFVLATVFRQSAMAIGLGLAYALVVELLIFSLLRGFGGSTVQKVQQWFPVANTGFLASSFGDAKVKGLPPAAAPFADATHAIVMLLLYVAVFSVLSAYLTRNRDITA